MIRRRVLGLVGVLAVAGAVLGALPAPDVDRPFGAESVVDAQESSLIEARIKGAADAPVTVLEISDFQCPYCRMFWEETLPVLMEEYVETGKIRLVFLNLPLPSLHPNAPAAHEFAMCAAAQDKFWPAHDLLFRHQATWAGLDDPSEYFLTLADSAGLSVFDLASCFESGRMRELIEEEASLNVRSGIRSTPSFVIERGLLKGVHPIETWRTLLDSLVEAKTASER